MTFERPSLVIFHGGTGAGEAENMVGRARAAAALATSATALAAGFETVILAVDSPEPFERAPAGVLLDLDPPGQPFDFDARLRGIVRHYGLARPAVMGSGSVPLAGVDDFRLIAEQLDSRDGRFITNNFFSADLTAWTPGEALFALPPIDRDNVLPRRLRDHAGLASVILPRTTATQFDLDTPIDLAVLALIPGLSPALAEAADEARASADRFGPLLRVLCDREGELVVAGRVGSQSWQYLERETACRVRMFSEERGLATAPAGHQPRSLLGFLIEELGFKRFFERMAELGDALVLDTRVIEAHLGIAPSREDRFQSDLLAPGRIEDAVLRRFTEAAISAPLPVYLGGHSLVAGGLMALNDIAWRENDVREGRG